MKVFNPTAVSLVLAASGCVIDETTQNDLTATEQGSELIGKGQHCVIDVSMLRDGEAPPPPDAVGEQCFNTFSDATYAATNGRVRLAPSVTPDLVTDELLNGTRADSSADLAADTIIGILYNNRNFSSTSGTKLLRSANSNCIGVFAVNIPLDFNDRTSSAEAFSSCNRIDLFEHTSFGGAFVPCGKACAYVGDAMNDRASSVKVYKL